MAAEQLSPATPRRPFALDQHVLFWLVPAAVYYGFLLCAGSSGLFGPVMHGLTFNSMLLHLLHGQFDVDPAAVGDEGYLRDGLIYSYFGIFPALFRVLVLWVPNFAGTDFTRISCLSAVVVMAAAKVISVRLLWRQAGAQARPLLLSAMIVAILVSGPQIEFLRPSIYQEAELWAGALSAIFVYFVLRGLVGDGGFTARLLNAMALVAGLCLLTRVSNAIGLYAAFGLVWLWVVWLAFRTRRDLAKFAVPLVIALCFVAATALINAGRWGNPLVFADFSKALINVQYPDRIGRLQLYGEFNLHRIGYGLSYYFAPFWVWRDAAGNFLWQGFENGYSACCSELPPSSFIVCDPLLIGLCIYGAATALRERTGCRLPIVAAGLGLLVPIFLMLTAFGTSYRYRMEFYPFFELFALLGFARLAVRPTGRAPVVVAATAGAGVVTAHAMWLLYMLSPLGPAGLALGPLGIVDFYRSLFP